MRPVIFNYTTDQSDAKIPSIDYDHILDLCKVNGKTIIENSLDSMSYVTKTKVINESDDVTENSFLLAASKTDVVRESDDVCEYQHSMLLTKTAAEMEHDD